MVSTEQKNLKKFGYEIYPIVNFLVKKNLTTQKLKKFLLVFYCSPFKRN